MQVIIYQQDTGALSVVYPTEEAVATFGIVQVARKDVPAGRPYKIVDRDSIPQERAFRDAWEADFGSPDGYGIGAEAWFAEQEQEVVP